MDEALITDIAYVLPRPRVRPTTLQVLLTLPPNSRSQFLMGYESSFLWYTEYPPDAHRGFEIPGAMTVLLRPASSNTTVPSAALIRARGAELILHTSSTLLSLPTPDFSMPYNVIILTSTLIALFFGSVVNALVRTWWVVDMDAVEEAEGLAGDLVGKEVASKETEREGLRRRIVVE